MKILLLSLDTPVGEKRRSKINYDYEIIWGTNKLEDVPQEMKDKIHVPYNVKDKDGLIKKKGCHMYSYYRILKKIVDEDLYNVIICEDDAILKNEKLLDDLENIKDLNEPVLLNAKLHHPKSYRYDKDFNDKDIKFHDGINDIDFNKYRWSCSACIYYPKPEAAKYIIDLLDKSNRLTYLDLYLSKNKIIKKLYYPSIFCIKDDGVSQVCDSKGFIDNYIN